MAAYGTENATTGLQDAVTALYEGAEATASENEEVTALEIEQALPLMPSTLSKATLQDDV